MSREYPEVLRVRVSADTKRLFELAAAEAETKPGTLLRSVIENYVSQRGKLTSEEKELADALEKIDEQASELTKWDGMYNELQEAYTNLERTSIGFVDDLVDLLKIGELEGHRPHEDSMKPCLDRLALILAGNDSNALQNAELRTFIFSTWQLLSQEETLPDMTIGEFRESIVAQIDGLQEERKAFSESAERRLNYLHEISRLFDNTGESTRTMPADKIKMFITTQITALRSGVDVLRAQRNALTNVYFALQRKVDAFRNQTRMERMRKKEPDTEPAPRQSLETVAELIGEAQSNE